MSEIDLVFQFQPIGKDNGLSFFVLDLNKGLNFS